MYDVSFAGSVITIGGATISEFMDDANPIEIQDTEVAGIEWSCNGRMIRTVKPSAILISVTVIPGSTSDDALRKIWKENFNNGGDIKLGATNKMLTCSISCGNSSIGSFSFTNGTCLSGAAAITSNGQGKMGGNTYTFAFEKVA